MLKVQFGRFTLFTGFTAFIIPLFCMFLSCRKQKFANRIQKICLIIYIALIIILTLFRNPSAEAKHLNLQPFWSYHQFDQADVRWQVYLNVFLFIPFGFLFSYTFNTGLAVTVIAGLLLSAGIEATQFFFSLGLCEVDDVLHNSLGTLIGYFYFRLVSSLRIKR